jgi:hypothetical protein
VFVGGDRFGVLAAAGARVQRPLWASTGVKNPDYSDTLYVTELVAPSTVNTMPEKTLDAVADHGDIKGDTISGTAETAQEVFDKLEAIGIDLTDVFLVLENDGVDKFKKSWQEPGSNQNTTRRRDLTPLIRPATDMCDGPRADATPLGITKSRRPNCWAYLAADATINLVTRRHTQTNTALPPTGRRFRSLERPSPVVRRRSSAFVAGKSVLLGQITHKSQVRRPRQLRRRGIKRLHWRQLQLQATNGSHTASR